MSHEHCILSREAKISSLSIESTYLLNLSFSSCLHLRTMCNLSLILRMTMILERMSTIGFVAITHVDVSRNYLKIFGMLIKLKVATKEVHNSVSLTSV